MPLHREIDENLPRFPLVFSSPLFSGWRSFLLPLPHLPPRFLRAALQQSLPAFVTAQRPLICSSVLGATKKHSGKIDVRDSSLENSAILLHRKVTKNAQMWPQKYWFCQKTDPPTDSSFSHFHFPAIISAARLYLPPCPEKGFPESGLYTENQPSNRNSLSTSLKHASTHTRTHAHTQVLLSAPIGSAVDLTTQAATQNLP